MFNVLALASVALRRRAEGLMFNVEGLLFSPNVGLIKTKPTYSFISTIVKINFNIC